MSTIRRHGSRTVFWNGATVNANDVSAYANVGREADQMAVYIDTSGASAFQVQIAHSSGDTTEGVTIDFDVLNLSNTAYWYDYNYQNNLVSNGGALGLFTFAGAARVAIGLPDWVGGFCRLKCTSGTAVTVTAGYEAWGD